MNNIKAVEIDELKKDKENLISELKQATELAAKKKIKLDQHEQTIQNLKEKQQSGDVYYVQLKQQEVQKLIQEE